jgi:predicted acylesterase/phospholipase RssA
MPDSAPLGGADLTQAAARAAQLRQAGTGYGTDVGQDTLRQDEEARPVSRGDGYTRSQPDSSVRTGAGTLANETPPRASDVEVMPAPPATVASRARKSSSPAPVVPAPASAPATLTPDVPTTTLQKIDDITAADRPSPYRQWLDQTRGQAAPPPPDLGNGFPLVKAGKNTPAERIHDFLAGKLSGLYNLAAGELLGVVNKSMMQGAGVDIQCLLQVERTLYHALAGTSSGYDGKSPPLFQELANGQAAYVNLGPERAADAEHMMLLFDYTSLDKIAQLRLPDANLDKVRQALLARALLKQFPAYFNTDGNFNNVNATESIATESVASIANRLNTFGRNASDPRAFYRWLVTRVDSNFRQTDPWVFATKPGVHADITSTKDSITPVWVQKADSQDPLGMRPLPKDTQKAYKLIMKQAGGGKAPTMQNLSDFADTAIGLDRDLLSGVQTYWTKVLREISPDQRRSLFLPLARTWATLNLVPPNDPNFDMVSPSTAPDIDLIDTATGKAIKDRYDRAMSISEVVDHTLVGLGIDERREFLNIISQEVQRRAPDLAAREQRVRQIMGDSYDGIDIDKVLSGQEDFRDPNFTKGLNQLLTALHPEQTDHQMTAQRAEIMRHRDMVSWFGRRFDTYGDYGFDLVYKFDNFKDTPLIVGQFYNPSLNPPTNGLISPLPTHGPQQVLRLGQDDGKPPIRISEVAEGGGGKGFVFADVMGHTEDALNNSPGIKEVDLFAGNSAGALNMILRAAGFSCKEQGEAQKYLDFKQFYADYMSLEGGVDAQVRGVNRTGLFTVQEMYKTVMQMVNDKLANPDRPFSGADFEARRINGSLQQKIVGRPILFADLPFRCRITSTVLNTNMPDDLKQKFGVAKDGEIVYSDDNTPYMDCIAAACASASVPGFFNAPQVQVCRLEERDGKLQPALYRIQNVDGGVVNNFPIAHASVGDDKNAALIVMPAYYQAPGEKPGDPPIQLSTLDFDQGQLARVNVQNDKVAPELNKNLGQFIAGVRDSGAGRAVIAFHLSDLGSQTKAVVQGRTKADTDRLLGLARQAGFSTHTADQGRAIVNANLPSKKHPKVEQWLLNFLLDKRGGPFRPHVLKGPEYVPATQEANGLGDMLIGVVAAQMVAPTRLADKQFEKA